MFEYVFFCLGLDPALPFFATSARHAKLDPSDADFVDVIHSNAGIFGKIEACGDIDFYVNGGQFQPACYGHRSKYTNITKVLDVFSIT